MKSLDRYQQDYNENGFISPVRIISFEEAKNIEIHWKILKKF